MVDKPPIPKTIYERIIKFLGAGGTGQIVLNVTQGRIKTVAIADHFRVDDDPVVPIDVQHPPTLKTR